ncbi:MAG: FKBP-type peptidyl-prolyl cis-trans isomerase [Thermoplasmata archaeon]
MDEGSKIRSALGAVLTSALLLIIAGCLGGPPPEEPKLRLSPIEGSLRAAAGDNVTFIVLLKNNRLGQEVLHVSVGSHPPGWSITLSNTTFEIGPKARKPVFVTVGIPPDTDVGRYTVKLLATPTLAQGGAVTKGLVINVIEPAEPVVVRGSQVRVDYTGYLSSYEVFDTSVRSVGSDIYIQKSPGFSPPALNKYEPLSFRVGEGRMVAGFESGVLGMCVGQSRTLAVEPREGYGKFERVRINLSETFPMLREMTILNFTQTYGEEPAPNKVVLEPYWGWKVHVVNVTQDSVTVLTLPEPGQTSTPYGWESRVVDVNGSADGGRGRIEVRHYPTAGVNASYKGIAAEIVELTSSHIELEYNTNYGNPLATQVLYFVIKVVAIS